MFAPERRHDVVDVQLDLFGESVKPPPAPVVPVVDHPSEEGFPPDAVGLSADFGFRAFLEPQGTPERRLSDPRVADPARAVRRFRDDDAVAAHRDLRFPAQVACHHFHGFVSERAEELAEKSVQLEAVAAPVLRHDLAVEIAVVERERNPRRNVKIFIGYARRHRVLHVGKELRRRSGVGIVGHADAAQGGGELFGRVHVLVSCQL